MARQFGAPYRRPHPERFEAGSWILDGGSRDLNDHVPDWDYQQDFVLGRTVTADLDGLREDCGLAPDSRVRFVAGYYCSDTLQRETGPPEDYLLRGAKRVDLQLEVKGSAVCRELDVHTEVTLLEAGSTESPLAPSKHGAMLWRNERVVRLEGGGSRFPVELASFEAAGQPGRAGWLLDWRTHDLDRPALGALRLLVNADREEIARAVSAPNDDHEARAIASTIRYDVGRRLMLTALEDRELLDRFPDFGDESLGRALADLISLSFGEESLNGLAAEARERPERFDARIQSALGIFDD